MIILRIIHIFTKKASTDLKGPTKMIQYFFETYLGSFCSFATRFQDEKR